MVNHLLIWHGSMLRTLHQSCCPGSFDVHGSLHCSKLSVLKWWEDSVFPASTPKSDSLLLALSGQLSKSCPQPLGGVIDTVFFDNHSVIAVHVQSAQMIGLPLFVNKMSLGQRRHWDTSLPKCRTEAGGSEHTLSCQERLPTNLPMG